MQGYEELEIRNQQKTERHAIKQSRIKLIGEVITDNPKQIINEIVQNIVERAIETAHKRSKETDKKLKRLLSGKLNRKRKHEISIKILKKN